MKKEDMLSYMKSLKQELKSEQIEIIGLFGSTARGDNNINSDVDILYKIIDTNKYLEQHSGWDSINFLADTKDKISKKISNKIDFVDESTLSDIGKKYILNEISYV